MAGVSFLAPLALLGLIALPLVWLILRISPPSPKVQTFPPLRLFSDISTEEETPAKTPLWLLLFRLAMVALISIALAQPVFQKANIETENRLLVIIDNNWLSAPYWSEILNEAESQIKSARRNNRNVALLLTNPESVRRNLENDVIQYQPAQMALNRIETLSPKAWIEPDQTLRTVLSNTDFTNTDVILLSSGLSAGSSHFISAIKTTEQVTLFQPTNLSDFALPFATQEIPTGFESTWKRPVIGLHSLEDQVIAYGANNSVIARAALEFEVGNDTATAEFEIPAQLRNRISHLRLSSINSAGAVQLFDDNWGRPLIGVMNGSGDTSSPLLSEPFYARTALQPHADIYDGDLSALLDINPSVIVMSDSQRTDDERLKDYVEQGGVLIRFAGPKLAKRVDELIPVRLRTGGRAIGGALSWETPQKLAPFETNSPFFGLDISDEITVSRQVMAQPGIETDTHSWARLEDGSPIVTAAPRGDGLIVLFHVTAGPKWSNLALSGLYVDMLRRILPLAKNQASRQDPDLQGDWVANRVLDGFGKFISPNANVGVIKDDVFSETVPSVSTPPGLYVQGNRNRALQTLEPNTDIEPISVPPHVNRKQYGGTKLQSLAGLGLAIGLLGLSLDALLAIIMSGRLRRLLSKPSQAFIAVIMSMSIFALDLPVKAQNAYTIQEDISTNQKSLQAATGLHFAYIQTGNSRTDRISENGLTSLGKQLDARTTIDVVGVHAINPAEDVLSFYPFLYWVISRDSAIPDDRAITALNDYIGSGGTLILDTRDAADQAVTGNALHPGLAKVTEKLDIPRLKPIPTDHVLTKSFYLLQSFPGRYANGQVWVAANTSTGGRDGVSPVIIGGHDWASAWALDETNRPLIETDKTLPRQQEFAVRFGVNIAMYTLAGNYKADQVHTAELVKRLGDNASQPNNLFQQPLERD